MFNRRILMLGQELDRYWETVVNTICDGVMIVNTMGPSCPSTGRWSE